MGKQAFIDHIFLEDIAVKLENGENIERALFSIEGVSEELLSRLQVGEEITEIIDSIEFKYPALSNLFASINHSDIEEILERVKSTAKLIESREDVIQEKQDMVKVHTRRIRIIRYVTMITIAMIAGFSPVFANLYNFINTGVFENSLSILSTLSISFLIVNLLNNYYLLKLGGEKRRIIFRLVIVLLLHIMIVIMIRIFISSFFIF